jgi:uncharacterized phage protein (TIGR01671 family)
MTMREILFRAKCKDNNKWIYGFYLNTSENTSPVIIDMECCSHAVNPETVGEFTGLYDKNGTKIFEGDIVHAIYRSKYIGGAGDTDWGDGIITYCGDYYSGASWEIDMLDGEGSRTFSASVECEVIGNEFDNPELLKGD